MFTDKTGTLTRNIMEFKSFLVGGERYGDVIESESRLSRR